jgi:trimethylamine--corrinoid protein Co-methyltransferase
MPKQYLRFLSKEDLKKIHNASLAILEKTGILIDHHEARKMLQEAGARVDHERKIVKFPPQLVEKSIKKAPQRVIYGARDPKKDLVLEPEGDIYSRPLLDNEGCIDLDTSKYRKVKMSDVKDWVRLSDALDNISYCAAPYPEVDDVPIATRDIRIMQTMLENTDKHIVLTPYTEKSMRDMIEMGLAVMGSEKELKKRSIFGVAPSAQSPLQYAEYAVDILLLAGKYGIPVELITMPLAGGTAPVTLAGAISVGHAEILAGIVIAEVANPGTPIVYSLKIMILDMSTGVGLAGAVENAIAATAGVQLARQIVGIPTSMSGPATDSLITDGQSILERVTNTLLPALAGANIVSSAGGLEHYYTMDPVQLVIDDEILGMTKRILRGFEINDDMLGLDVVTRVGPGGNFLSDKHTLKYFRGEYYRPHILNRRAREIWQTKGGKDLNENARQRAEIILREHKPAPLDGDTVKELDSIVKKLEKD